MTWKVETAGTYWRIEVLEPNGLLGRYVRLSHIYQLEAFTT